MRLLLSIVRPRRGRLWGLCLAASLMVTFGSASARADEDERAAAMIYGALVVMDASFAAYDIAAAVDDRPVVPGVAIPQFIFSLPQYLGANLAFSFTQIDDSPFSSEMRDLPSLPLVILPAAAMSSANTIHGLASAIDPDGEEIRPANLGFVSAVVGVNLPFTMAGLAAGITGRWPTPAVSIPQVGLSAGSTMVSLVKAVEAAPRDRPGWGLAVGWSATTLAHGALALALHEPTDDADEWAAHGRQVTGFSVAPLLTSGGSGAPGGVIVTSRF